VPLKYAEDQYDFLTVCHCM